MEISLGLFDEAKTKMILASRYLFHNVQPCPALRHEANFYVYDLKITQNVHYDQTLKLMTNLKWQKRLQRF